MKLIPRRPSCGTQQAILDALQATGPMERAVIYDLFGNVYYAREALTNKGCVEWAGNVVCYVAPLPERVKATYSVATIRQAVSVLKSLGWTVEPPKELG